jgi:hypothetical protein
VVVDFVAVIASVVLGAIVITDAVASVMAVLAVIVAVVDG